MSQLVGQLGFSVPAARYRFRSQSVMRCSMGPRDKPEDDNEVELFCPHLFGGLLGGGFAFPAPAPFAVSSAAG
jgi:hypothetical protein